MSEGIERRDFLKQGMFWAALPTAAALGACQPLAKFLERLAATCPESGTDSGGVNWTPDVLHPVFYGYSDIDTTDGAPIKVRIWYPSHDGSTRDAPILKQCLVRWPLVLFLHGQPPPECPTTYPYHERWSAIPITLARSGYVVAVPSHTPSSLPGMEPFPPDAWPLALLDWVRSAWQHSQWVDSRLEATAVVGHSYGALYAAKVVRARPEVSSFVSLGGTWTDVDVDAALNAIAAPKLFIYTSGPFEDLDAAGFWPRIQAPKIAVTYAGEHFDYIPDEPGCAEPRGPCSRIERLAGDLVALFISRHTPVPLSRAHIPANLDPAPVLLSMRQHFFAGRHVTEGRLVGISAFVSDSRCAADLRWSDGGAEEGRRHLPS